MEVGAAADSAADRAAADSEGSAAAIRAEAEPPATGSAAHRRAAKIASKLYGRIKRAGRKIRAGVSGPAGVRNFVRLRRRRGPSRQIFRSECALRFKGNHPARAGRCRADSALVAGAESSPADADERRGSAQFRGLFSHRISRYEGPPEGSLWPRPDRGSKGRREILSGPGRA